MQPLRIDLPPAELHPNARAGWQVRARVRTRYRVAAGELVWGHTMEQFGRLARWPRAVVGLRFVLPRRKRGAFQPHDPDNLIAWAKTAIDALTDGGLLADDREVVYLPPTQTALTDDGPGYLEIDVRPWDGNGCPLCQNAKPISG